MELLKKLELNRLYLTDLLVCDCWPGWSEVAEVGEVRQLDMFDVWGLGKVVQLPLERGVEGADLNTNPVTHAKEQARVSFLRKEMGRSTLFECVIKH